MHLGPSPTVSPDEFPGAVRTAVGHHENFEIGSRVCREYAVEAWLDVTLFVVREHHYRPGLAIVYLVSGITAVPLSSCASSSREEFPQRLAHYRPELFHCVPAADRLIGLIRHGPPGVRIRVERDTPFNHACGIARHHHGLPVGEIRLESLDTYPVTTQARRKAPDSRNLMQVPPPKCTGATANRALEYSASRSSTKPGASVRMEFSQRARSATGAGPTMRSLSAGQRCAIAGQQFARNQSNPWRLGHTTSSLR